MVVVMLGCVQSSSVVCPNGQTCPTGTVCAALASKDITLCAEPADVAACKDMQDTAQCLTDGNCVDGVCLHHCGDGVRTGAEECDGSDLGPKMNCTDLGYYTSAPLVCSPSCTYDVVGEYSAGCQGKCGDGVVNTPEEVCEDQMGWTDARTCIDFGLDAGDMGCLHCGPSFAGCKDIGLKLALQDSGPIHGHARDDVWIVEGTKAIHFDGSMWTSYPLPQPVAIGFNTVWVEPSGHAWVAGTVSSPMSPAIAYWDGTTWTDVPVFSSGGYVRGLWASGAGDAWVVAETGTPASGFHGVMLHATSATASTTTIPAVGGLNALWGSAANDVWAVGDSGTILHYDGTSWQVASSPTTSDLTAIYGSSASDVWAIGITTLIHYNGSSWTVVPAPGTYTNFQQCVFTDGARVWIGANRAIYELEAGSWIPITTSQGFYGQGIWGSGPGDMWFSGAGTFHSDGAVWGTWSVTGAVSSLWFDGAHPWALANVSATSATVQTFDGNSWSDAGLAGSGRISSIAGTSPTDVWVVRAVPPPIPTPPPTYPVAEIDHYNGTWTASQTINNNASALPDAVWANAPNDVWVVGYNFGFWHYTGTWSQVGASGQMGTIWGSGPNDVWAGGNGAEIRHYDGQSWTISRPADPGNVKNVTAIWGSGPSDVYAVGDSIYHYDGTTWTSSHPVASYYVGVAGTGPNDVFVLGGTVERNLLHWDGTEWSPVRPQWTDSQNPQSIGTGPNGVYVGLGDGTIVDLVRDVPW
jgi:hypothetical protein